MILNNKYIAGLLSFPIMAYFIWGSSAFFNVGPLGSLVVALIMMVPVNLAYRELVTVPISTGANPWFRSFGWVSVQAVCIFSITFVGTLLETT